MVESAQSRQETRGLEQLRPRARAFRSCLSASSAPVKPQAAGLSHYFTLFILPDVSARLVTVDTSLLLDTPVVSSTGSLPSH